MRLERFKQVSELERSGHYIFASDPNDRLACYPLPNSERPSDNILGPKPLLERELDFFIKEKFNPVIVQYDSSNKSFIESEWLLQNGVIRYLEEYYKLYSSHQVEADIWRLELRAASQPILVSDRSGKDYPWTPPPPDYNGTIELEISGSGGKLLDDRGPFWRGEIFLRGEMKGEVIKATRDYIQDTIKSLNVPFWYDQGS